MEDPETTYYNIRRAAEVHRQVRKYVREYIKPGLTMTEIVETIENGTRALVEENGLESGIGFPTGVSLNHCAAHYTPNAGDTTGESIINPLLLSIIKRPLVLQQGDVLKVDFGVHVNGRILDSAFTLNFEPTYDNLLTAVKDATNTGIRVSAYSFRMSSILFTMTLGIRDRRSFRRSRRCDPGDHGILRGGGGRKDKTGFAFALTDPCIPMLIIHLVKVIGNLSGHSINRYQIHGGKSVQLIKNDDQTKMEEGEYFAIETFGSTGVGRVIEQVRGDAFVCLNKLTH